MTSADVLRRVLARFPPVTFAMAYGSAVFKQLNHNTGAAMVDYVLAVRGSEQWHADNMQRNARDYSAMRLAGPRALSAFQRWGGGRLLYNTLVRKSAFTWLPLRTRSGAARGRCRWRLRAGGGW